MAAGWLNFAGVAVVIAIAIAVAAVIVVCCYFYVSQYVGVS